MNLKCKKNSVMNILKENLTNEFCATIYSSFESTCWGRKIFVTLFLLTASVLASYTTLDLILTYLEYGVTTTRRTIYEEQKTFPKVTFCNVNPFTTKYGYELVRNALNQTLIDEMSYNQKYEIAYVIRSVLSLALENTSISNRQRIGHDLKDVLIGCRFNFEPCTHEDFVWEWDSHYGNCYSFNSGMNATKNFVDFKNSHLAGFAFGLQLDLYVNFYENLSWYNSLTGGMGAVIRLDNVSHVKDHGLDAIIVSNGVRTNLALKHEYNYIKSKPYSNCDIDERGQDFDSNLFKLIHASPYDYTSNFCFVQCLQQLNINECNCSYPLFASVFGSPKCGSVSQIQCVLNVYYTKFLGERNFIENNCSKECPLECNSTQYKYTSDYNELIGDVYFNLLKKNKYLKEDFLERTLNTEMARKSVSKINIFLMISYKYLFLMTSQANRQKWT
jgi:hypothetical protein